LAGVFLPDSRAIETCDRLFRAVPDIPMLVVTYSPRPRHPPSPQRRRRRWISVAE